MQTQELKRKKLKFHHFKVVLKSFPKAPISFDLNSFWVNRSASEVNLKMPIVTQDRKIIAEYREEGFIEIIVPAPSLTMGQFIEGSGNLTFIKEVQNGLKNG